jgi:hypothetical protein
MKRGPYKKEPESDRFWRKVSFGHGPNACWLWKGALEKNNHGVFRLSGKTTGLIYAHRYVLGLLGRDDEDTHHTCHNEECVNPDHLVGMTHSEHRKLHARIRREVNLGSESA